MGKEYEAIAKEWLEKAESDFQYANASFEAFDDFYSQMCVLCHDAGEKYLKAYIISLGKKPGKIHDLVTLYNQCVENEGSDSELTGLREGCKILNRYYIPLKSPWGSFSEEGVPPLAKGARGIWRGGTMCVEERGRKHHYQPTRLVFWVGDL